MYTECRSFALKLWDRNRGDVSAMTQPRVFQSIPEKDRKRTLRQRGVGMLEILITLLILSIGFLAVAKMQVQGMRFSQSAYIEAQAYFMITDMMDRMRSNADGVRSGFYDGKSTSATAVNPNCTVNYCNEQSLAYQDIFDWSAMIHPLRGTPAFVPALPSSDTVQASAQIESLSGNMYRLTAQWIERIGNSEKPQQLSLEFAL